MNEEIVIEIGQVSEETKGRDGVQCETTEIFNSPQTAC